MSKEKKRWKIEWTINGSLCFFISQMNDIMWLDWDLQNSLNVFFFRLDCTDDQLFEKLPFFLYLSPESNGSYRRLIIFFYFRTFLLIAGLLYLTVVSFVVSSTLPTFLWRDFICLSYIRMVYLSGRIIIIIFFF